MEARGSVKEGEVVSDQFIARSTFWERGRDARAPRKWRLVLLEWLSFNQIRAL
jgi:hypothetical protein